MKFKSDIDIDLGSRTNLLEILPHTPAAMRNANYVRKHASGVYVTKIPYDPINQVAALDYKIAHDRGYFKLDLLNVYVYEKIKNENHLLSLMREPNWYKLKERKFVMQVLHLNNQYNNLRKMPEPVDSIIKLSMFLSIIRPGKKHLIGKSWSEIAETVWSKDDDGYSFKRSHSLAYSHLVVVNMNLLEECFEKTQSYNLENYP